MCVPDTASKITVKLNLRCRKGSVFKSITLSSRKIGKRKTEWVSFSRGNGLLLVQFI